MRKIVLFFLILLLYANNGLNFSLKNKFVELFNKKKYQQAFHLLERSKIKNAFVLNNMAFMYYKGLGVVPNQQKAIDILENALKKYPDNSMLYFNLAVMYYYGYLKKLKNDKYKIIIDREKAKKLLQKAIKLGNKKAKTFYYYFYVKKYEKK